MLQEFFFSGGKLMYPLLVGSVVAVAIILERLFYWFRFWMRTDRKLRRELTGLYVHQDKVRRSRDEVVGILAEFVRNPDDTTGPVIKAERVVRDSKKHLGLLSLIASVSTSVGLLGTVFGVSLAFREMSQNNPTGLAGALSIALNTTMFGLSIFLPSYMAYTFFAHLSQAVSVEIEEAMETIRSSVRARRERLVR